MHDPILCTRLSTTYSPELTHTTGSFYYDVIDLTQDTCEVREPHCCATRTVSENPTGHE